MTASKTRLEEFEARRFCQATESLGQKGDPLTKRTYDVTLSNYCTCLSNYCTCLSSQVKARKHHGTVYNFTQTLAALPWTRSLEETESLRGKTTGPYRHHTTEL